MSTDADEAVSQLAGALYMHSKDRGISSHMRELFEAAANEIVRLRAALIGTAKALESDYPETAKLIRDEVKNATRWKQAGEETRNVQ